MRSSFTAYLDVLRHELGGSTEIIVDFCGLENIVIRCYRNMDSWQIWIAADKTTTTREAWRDHQLPHLPKNDPLRVFLDNKSTGLMYYRWFSITILLPRPGSTQNRPNTVLRLLPSIKNLHHAILIFNKIPCIFFKYSHNFWSFPGYKNSRNNFWNARLLKTLSMKVEFFFENKSVSRFKWWPHKLKLKYIFCSHILVS